MGGGQGGGDLETNPQLGLGDGRSPPGLWLGASGPQDPCAAGVFVGRACAHKGRQYSWERNPSFRGFSQVSRGVWDQQEESIWGQARMKTPEI